MLSPPVLKAQALVEKLGHLLPEILSALLVIVPPWVGRKLGSLNTGALCA